MQTLETRLKRLRANAELQRIMAAWSGYLSGGQYDSLLGLFADREDVWASMPWGTYRGPEGLQRLYRGLYRSLYRDGHHGKPGVLTVSGINTPLIDVDEDGRRAAGTWISPGVFTLEDGEGPNGLRSYWSWKQLRGDFILDGSGWKLLHLQVQPLFTTEFSKNWTEPQEAPWTAIPPEFRPDGPEADALPPLLPREIRLPDYQGTAWERTPASRVLRLELIAEAQRLMGVYSTRMRMGQTAQIPDLFALQTPTVRAELLQGVYDGAESIRKLYTVPAAVPEAERAVEQVQSLETPVITAAGDCKTARGVWVSPGYMNVQDRDGVVTGCWSWRKYAADFVVEDGVLKIWHLHEYALFESEYGSGEIRSSGTFPGLVPAGTKPDGAPTTPFRLSEDSVYPYTPAVPKPYSVFDPDYSY